MRHIIIGLILVCSLAACGGGGGGGGARNVTPAAAVPQSEGGIWFGFDSTGETVSFYVAENGKSFASLRPAGGLLPSFGVGAIDVTSNNLISGSLDLQGPVIPPTIFPEDLACSISGSVVERQSLQLDVSCSDVNGVVYDEALNLNYDTSYERDSSLAALAGNYTREFRPATNVLTIAPDGTISGMVDNAPQCLVDGTASIIDANYTFIDVTWTLSSCTDSFGFFEGVEMSGFAFQTLDPAGDPEAYYFGLTGETQNGIYPMSVLYMPL